jgi:hypothetical protein
VKPGKRPLPQSKLPPSTITPPIDVPWPPMNLVREWITTLAPCEIGLTRYGVGSVLSMTSGMPSALPIAETSSNGKVSSLGLPTDSPKNAFVLSVTARRKFSGSLGSTNLTVMPSLGRV